MKKAKPSVTYETRYKHKLNMLGPGTVMLNGNIKRIDRIPKLCKYISDHAVLPPAHSFFVHAFFSPCSK